MDTDPGCLFEGHNAFYGDLTENELKVQRFNHKGNITSERCYSYVFCCTTFIPSIFLHLLLLL